MCSCEKRETGRATRRAHARVQLIVATSHENAMRWIPVAAVQFGVADTHHVFVVRVGVAQGRPVAVDGDEVAEENDEGKD